MPDNTTNLLLPFIAAAQAQKHITHNEAIRQIDVLVNTAVESITLATPPALPLEGQVWAIAASPTGAWAGKAGFLAAWQDGAWFFYQPRDGWVAWDRAAFRSVVYRTNLPGWTGLVTPVFPDAEFTLQDDLDPTKQLRFQLSGLATATTRVLAMPAADGTIATLNGATQTFANTTTFSGATVTVGTATAAATYGLGTGATTSGVTKSINIGTAGLAGSTSNIAIGSAVAGALGTLTINSPTVTFASGVTTIGAAAANISALYLGLGGAIADATNRLSVNAPATLLNHAGASHEATINKNAVANDAALAFKTGFSTRALFGLLASDDWSVKVSPNGSTFSDALIVDRTTGRSRFPVGVALDGLASDPGAPSDGWIWHNATTGQLRTRIGGATRIISRQDLPWLAPAAGDYALTTTGAGGGATTTTTGVADRMELFPFIPRDDIAVDRLSVNVTTLVASAQGKIVLYTADALGRPASLILETAALDFGIAGLREATVSQTLRAGMTYWLGLRHSLTAVVSAWLSTATPDINGGAPVTTARKVLRRSLAFATAAPGSWGFSAAEINVGPAAAIWLRAA